MPKGLAPKLTTAKFQTRVVRRQQSTSNRILSLKSNGGAKSSCLHISTKNNDCHSFNPISQDVPKCISGTELGSSTPGHRASSRVEFVEFLRAHVQFCWLIRRTSQPTFSDFAITDRHSDTTFFQLGAHWVQISWSVGSEKSFGHVSILDFLNEGRTPYPLGQVLR